MKKIRGAYTVILHAHDFNALLGCVMAKQLLRNRVRLVYDCHELTPGTYQEWYGSFVSRIVGRLEFAGLHWVDAIVAANEAILSHLRRASSAPAVVVNTCPTVEEVPQIQSSDAKKKLGLDGLFVILFTGKVRQDYDLDMIMNVARELKQKKLLDFRFVFLGPPESTADLTNTIMNEELQNWFDFRGWVADEDLLLYYIASDLCFAVTRDLGSNTRVLTPIKLFESMACGVPVAVRDGTLASEIVRHWHCGIVVDAKQTTFSSELRRLKENPEELRRLGAAGRNAFRTRYNGNRMEEKLLQLYTELQST